MVTPVLKTTTLTTADVAIRPELSVTTAVKRFVPTGELVTEKL